MMKTRQSSISSLAVWKISCPRVWSLGIWMSEAELFSKRGTQDEVLMLFLESV